MTGVALLSVLAALAATSPLAAAQSGQAGADCLGAVQPQYPALDSPPNIGFSRARSGHASVAGAGCFDNPDAPATWLTVASLVTSTDSAATLVARVGAISQLLPVQYWSTTEHKWRPIASAAAAIVSPDSRKPRPDFSPAELLAPGDRYYSL